MFSAMAPSGPLFLLLSSSLLLCSLSSPSSSNYSSSIQQKDHLYRLQKRGPKTKAVLTAAEYIAKIGSAASPFIEMIPVAGEFITSIVKIASFITDLTKPDPTQTLLTELKSLEIKLDNYRVEQKWDTWASHYATYETNIKVTWNEFEKLVNVLADKGKNNETKTNHINNFKKLFKPIALSTKQLHQVLTAQKPSFSTDFGKVISEKFKCHEKEIKLLAVFINGLIYQGNTVNLFYNSLIKVDDINMLAEIAFDSSKVMFEIHKNCISNSVKYVKEDVTNLIKENRKSNNRNVLAKNIRTFLEATYDRYNWITVAFITKNSKHDKIEILNKHILSGFIEVSHGEVTVAVARQLKGKHTKADKVRKAIEKCVDKSVECQKVEEKLSNCKETVDGINLSKVYTAVHAFISKSHDSFKALNAKEAPEEEYIGTDTPSEIPYLYTGECTKYKIFKSGQFRVLIKSDEELMGESLCQKLNCGGKGKGKCELLDNNQVPVCQCEKGLYGENCEESVEDYKKRLRGEMPQN